MKMRSTIAMLATALVLVTVSNPSWAANPFKYEEFGWIVSDFKEMMLEHCRKRGTPTLDATGILGPLNDPHSFRRACGQGLHGRDVPGQTQWTFYYARLADDGGVLDILGIQRLIAWKGAAYSLVIAWETRRQMRDGQADQVQSHPAIVLFQQDGALWRPVWNYANAVTNDWNDPWDYAQQPDGTPLGLDDLKAIWMKHITGEYPGVFWNIKDARGTGFP